MEAEGSGDPIANLSGITLRLRGDKYTAGTWTDLSTNNLDFTQGMAAQQPAAITTNPVFNNMPTVRFDGLDDNLQRTNATSGPLKLTGNFSVFSVISYEAGASAQDDWYSPMFEADTDSGLLLGVNHNTSNRLRAGVGNGSLIDGYDGTLGNSLVADTPEILSHVFSNPVSDLVQDVYQNGGDSGLNPQISHTHPFTSIFYDGTTPAAIGLDTNSLPPFNEVWQGDIAEIIVFSEVLSDADRQLVEGSLSWRYGVETNLPDAHPFRFVNPNAVPEPAGIAIWSLIGLALTGFGYYRTRRKK